MDFGGGERGAANCWWRGGGWDFFFFLGGGLKFGSGAERCGVAVASHSCFLSLYFFMNLLCFNHILVILNSRWLASVQFLNAFNGGDI